MKNALRESHAGRPSKLTMAVSVDLILDAMEKGGDQSSLSGENARLKLPPRNGYQPWSFTEECASCGAWRRAQ